MKLTEKVIIDMPLSHGTDVAWQPPEKLRRVETNRISQLTDLSNFGHILTLIIFAPQFSLVSESARQ